MPTARQILIVDDHALLIDALEIHLKQLAPPVRLWRATSMLQALSLREKSGPIHLALLDLHMPDMDGLAGMRRLRETDPDLPVVIMSGDDSPETVHAVLEAGARGFIPKTLRGPAFQDAIRRVLAGERYVPDHIELHPSAPQVEARLHLTAREHDVLMKLVDGQSNKEIARAIDVEPSTVALHLTNLYRKLQVTSRAQAIRRAFDLGLTAAHPATSS